LFEQFRQCTDFAYYIINIFTFKKFKLLLIKLITVLKKLIITLTKEKVYININNIEI